MPLARLLPLALYLAATGGCIQPSVGFLESRFEKRVQRLERKGQKLDKELKEYVREMNELRQSASRIHNNAESTATKFRGLLDQTSSDLERPSSTASP